MKDFFIINGVKYEYSYEQFSSIEGALSAIPKDKILQMINIKIKEQAKVECYLRNIKK
jgi:hypothetical protein